jgi:hypothetical protein
VRRLYRLVDKLTMPVFVRLDKWLDELGRHELDFVAMRTETSCPVMRPATGFYPDEHRGQLSDKGHQGISCQTLAPENFPRRVSPHEMKHFFGQIDRNGVKLLRHGTRLLVVT